MSASVAWSSDSIRWSPPDVSKPILRSGRYMHPPQRDRRDLASRLAHRLRRRRGHQVGSDPEQHERCEPDDAALQEEREDVVVQALAECLVVDLDGLRLTDTDTERALVEA